MSKVLGLTMDAVCALSDETSMIHVPEKSGWVGALVGMISDRCAATGDAATALASNIVRRSMAVFFGGAGTGQYLRFLIVARRAPTVTSRRSYKRSRLARRSPRHTRTRWAV